MNLPLLYDEFTERIVSFCPAPDKFAHVFAGMAIWLVASLLLRKPLASTTPVIAVAVLEFLNECMDRLAHGSWQWADTLGDAASTLFWPAVLLAALNFYPWLGSSQKSSEGGPRPASVAAE